MSDDISELVARLRRYPDREDNVPVLHLCADAADTLERLDAVANEWARVASAEHDRAAEWQKRAEKAEAERDRWERVASRELDRAAAAEREFERLRARAEAAEMRLAMIMSDSQGN